MCLHPRIMTDRCFQTHGVHVLTLRLIKCDMRAVHRSICSGRSMIWASRTPETMICWVESTIIPWFVAPVGTKQIDWSCRESNMNHWPRRNRVLRIRRHSQVRLDMARERVFLTEESWQRSSQRLDRESDRVRWPDETACHSLISI